MKLKFGQLVHATARPLTGDLNGDDQITPADAAIVLAFGSRRRRQSHADVSGDGRVTSSGALAILQGCG